MVMLNGKTYLPSSYVGSLHFTRMEKTAHTTFSDREKYPTTKEVQLLLTLRLVSVIRTPKNTMDEVRWNLNFFGPLGAKIWRGECHCLNFFGQILEITSQIYLANLLPAFRGLAS